MNNRRSFIRQAGLIAGTSILASPFNSKLLELQPENGCK